MFPGRVHRFAAALLRRPVKLLLLIMVTVTVYLITPPTTTYLFYRHRLRLWEDGRCVDSPDGIRVEVSFCDVSRTQEFSLHGDGRLIWEDNGGCVGAGQDGAESGVLTLSLVNCASQGVIRFNIVNGSYIRALFTEPGLFLTPLYTDNKPGFCHIQSVGLADLDPVISRIVLLEESLFLEDRRALKTTEISADDNCDFSACKLNQYIPPIEKLPPDQVQLCDKPQDCVTLVVKTARRPHLVMRLAQSVRDSYGYDLPIACYDDGPDDYPDEVWEELARFPLLKYVVSEELDLGIAEGRNQALELVQTKYFFILDDDVMFVESADIMTMIRVLDTTDAMLVGIRLMFRANFAALIKVGYFDTPYRRLGYFPGTCAKLNQTVPDFPQCYRCELNSNVFLARTAHVRAIGGWDPELKVFEHKDVFIRMKLAGYKLATCGGILLKHDKPEDGTQEQGEGYIEKRRRGTTRFRKLSNARYNVHDVFSYKDAEVNENGEVMVDVGKIPPFKCF